MGCFFLLGSLPTKWHDSLLNPRPQAAAPAPVVDKPQYLTANIEDIEPGDTVLAENPEVFDEDPAEADEAAESEEGHPAAWREVGLRMRRRDGTHLDVQFLRPPEWLKEYGVKPGETVELDLTESGAAGRAEGVSMEPCPEIAPPPSPKCRLVTGTYAHESADVRELVIEGREEPIGVTANHPFWSEDRQGCVRAGELRKGEALRTADGSARRVAVKVREGRLAVYNLEVDLEHVHFVSPPGILVPNYVGKRGSESPRAARGRLKHEEFKARVRAKGGKWDAHPRKDAGNWRSTSGFTARGDA